tara:strand:- start:609 stop:1241 length:633 start_codon:yes stop_codon:yes gene_type:complete
MINRQLLEKGYMIVNGFVNPEYCHELYQDLLKDGRTENTFMCDDFHGAVHNHPNPVAAVEILHYMTKYMTDLVEESLFPTYSYMRIYNKDSFLIKHTDRPACEISATVHLGSDKEWSMGVERPITRARSKINLKPGDAIIYLGCTTQHWREGSYTGDHFCQLFLHWVRSRGKFAYTLNDKDRTQPPSGWVGDLVTEYENMLTGTTPSTDQ